MRERHTTNTERTALDHGFVRLVDHLGSDLTVVNSARVSFGKRVEELGDGDRRLVNYLARHSHTSPFRHVVLQFHVKAPEFVARQWYKHVIGCNYGDGEKDHAWNEISGRYVDQSEIDLYIPEVIRGQAVSNKQASAGALPDEAQRELRSTMKVQLLSARAKYNRLIERGVAREQARLVLPLAMYTEWYWTASLQAVAHFVSLRTHTGAQWEIQEYARLVEDLACVVAPYSLEQLLAHTRGEKT